MRTHTDIVRAAGGAEPVAVARAVSIHTVKSWMARDKIPDEHWSAFADAGWASLEELAGYSASKRAEYRPTEERAA